jgi:hypothetical protein
LRRAVQIDAHSTVLLIERERFAASALRQITARREEIWPFPPEARKLEYILEPAALSKTACLIIRHRKRRKTTELPADIGRRCSVPMLSNTSLHKLSTFPANLAVKSREAVLRGKRMAKLISHKLQRNLYGRQPEVSSPLSAALCRSV